MIRMLLCKSRGGFKLVDWLEPEHRFVDCFRFPFCRFMVCCCWYLRWHKRLYQEHACIVHYVFVYCKWVTAVITLLIGFFRGPSCTKGQPDSGKKNHLFLSISSAKSNCSKVKSDEMSTMSCPSCCFRKPENQ